MLDLNLGLALAAMAGSALLAGYGLWARRSGVRVLADCAAREQAERDEAAALHVVNQRLQAALEAAQRAAAISREAAAKALEHAAEARIEGERAATDRWQGRIVDLRKQVSISLCRLCCCCRHWWPGLHPAYAAAAVEAA
jgi:hypothetical protein